MEARYRCYLEPVDGPDYGEKVFAVIDKEDSPRTLGFQLDLLRHVGFRNIEILHKAACYAAFGGIKAPAANRRQR